MLYTGGTTGTPKAALLTHANLRANVNRVPMPHEGAETFLALLPFFQAFRLTFNVLSAVHKAATQVLPPSSTWTRCWPPTDADPLRYADDAGGGRPL
ncbi:AMP-binding protein [Actinomyces sp. 2119]|uniref:AMP-binding protein n=1 Tax=Actinomyces sp. 2119 TaxID=2321393 RepID=UPI0028730AAD|nr:AMP-binding protein [Actinomyces sp. 2119]